MNSLSKFLLTAAAATGLAVGVHATPELVISDGTSTIYVLDNGAGDLASNAGQITWAGSIGVWSLNVSSGVTGGTIGAPSIDLSGQSTSTGAGKLDIYYLDNNFGPTDASFTASIGGTLLANSTLAYASALDATNNLLGPWSINPLTPWLNFSAKGAFSGASSSGVVNVGNPYSLVLYTELVHKGVGTSSYDALLETNVPDSATTSLLVGLGLVAVGAFAFRTRRARA